MKIVALTELLLQNMNRYYLERVVNAYLHVYCEPIVEYSISNGNSVDVCSLNRWVDYFLAYLAIQYNDS